MQERDAANRHEFSPYTGMTWPAYLCAAQGHIRRGLGYDTNPDNAVWASHCERCGAKL